MGLQRNIYPNSEGSAKIIHILRHKYESSEHGCRQRKLHVQKKGSKNNMKCFQGIEKFLVLWGHILRIVCR